MKKLLERKTTQGDETMIYDGKKTIIPEDVMVKYEFTDEDMRNISDLGQHIADLEKFKTYSRSTFNFSQMIAWVYGSRSDRKVMVVNV